MTFNRTWHEFVAWVEGPVPRSLINEPLAEEPQTALERARRAGRWMKRGETALTDADARRRKYQAELDRWVQWQRNEAEWEHRLMRELDPYGWGHWN